MNYHNITHDDMSNGDGLRVVLWLAGCEHHCDGCQNPITWNSDDGLRFDDRAKFEIFKELEKKYVAGITFSGGDPLHESNVDGVLKLIREIRQKFPNKTIWLYTGYKLDELTGIRKEIAYSCDVVVDGKFIKELADVNYPWAGSTNQKVWRFEHERSTYGKSK